MCLCFLSLAHAIIEIKKCSNIMEPCKKYTDTRVKGLPLQNLGQFVHLNNADSKG